MAKVVWVGIAMGLLALGGCLGSVVTQKPATAAERLQQAKASAASAEWPAARESAVAFWVAGCKKAVASVDDCASAQLIRGQAELATEAPESALLAFNWVLQSGSAAAKEEASQGAERAKAALQKLLGERATGMSWLVIEQDFEDNHRFGPERAAYTLDGKPLDDVTSPQEFALREHRVLAQAIAPGPHQLAVEIHWRGHGTLDSYYWKSFNPVEVEASEGGAIVASLAVRYSDGGPSNDSIDQRFQITSLP